MTIRLAMFELSILNTVKSVFPVVLFITWQMLMTVPSARRLECETPLMHPTSSSHSILSSNSRLSGFILSFSGVSEVPTNVLLSASISKSTQLLSEDKEL